MENTATFSFKYPLKILIAEIGRDLRSSTLEMLRTLGYRPEVAADSNEMLTMTKANSYDVILMDVHMPEAEQMLPGQLRTGDARRPLVIGLTDSGKPDFQQICLQARMDHCICMPVDAREFKLQLKACSVLTGNSRVRGRR